MCRTALLLAGVLTAGMASADQPSDLPLLFEDSFENGADRWQPTDPAAWRVVEADGNKVYNQFQLSKYQPPHRSPHNISLIKELLVGDFILTAKVKSTNPKAGAHQDMCIFFHYQNPAHFYYVHLGKRPDPHSSQIMIVDGADRKMITNHESPGIPWDEAWHNVKIVRRVGDGTIEIYFDDMDKPKMTSVDKTFTWGQVGLGSFDDHGFWDDVRVYGRKLDKAPAVTGD